MPVVVTRTQKSKALSMGALQSPLVVSPAAIRVLLVVEVRLYRDGLASSLAGRKNLDVVGTAANRDDAVALVASRQADVVVLDMATRGSLEVVRVIRASAPTVKILAFAVEEADRDILACAEAGVAGYVFHDASTDDLVAAIESIMRGELLCPPRTAALLLGRLASLATVEGQTVNDVPLTRREREIVTLIDGGGSNKEIALRLNIEVATVKNHVHNILDKLQVTTRGQAAARLRENRRPGSRPLVLDGA